MYKGVLPFFDAIKSTTQSLSVKSRRLSRPFMSVASIVMFTACAVVGPQQKTNVNPTEGKTASQKGVPDSLQPGVNDALAGTAWRLVEIVSMDDRVDAPKDRSLYTLEFKAEGSMRVRADCNLGSGFWTSASAGQLRFGPIAATHAMCPPGSLHDLYMTQFPWVRSYVMKDGRLFLATMADGSIIEFEPMPRK